MENKISGSAINILLRYLEELEEKDLKKFTVLLNNYPVKKDCLQIPRARLEKASCATIADEMIIHYQEGYALEVAGQLLYSINRRDLFEKFQSDSQKYSEKNPKLQETQITDLKKNYMKCTKEKFAFIEEKDSRPGEVIHLKKRYTKLLIVKNHRPQMEREHEIMYTGRKHLEILAQRAGHSYSSIAALFDPDEDGHVPRTIMLQGAAGIGKTMTARKMMLDWASGELFQGRFDYVFYINCREINQLSEQETIVELLSHSCPGMSPPMSEIEAEPGKVLFIIDGFDELNISIDPTTGDPSRKTHEDNTIMGLIRRRVFLLSSVLITTRPTALKKLQKCFVASRFAEILGFSDDDRKEYFTKFFKSKRQGVRAFNIVKANDILFTMCFVPIACWIVCTVIKERMEKKEDPVYALRTTTSVYMLFLSNLLKQQSSDSVQPIHMNPKRLCALARDGICQQKILFTEEDLTEHGLEIPAVQSLFLKNDIFLKDTERENCYSFIHLSFQEFFAAMFYVLRENEASRGFLHYIWQHVKSITSYLTADHTENPRRAVISLLEASREQEHLMLTVRFLFGLLNKETLSEMETRFQWKISPDIKPALLQWVKEEMKLCFSDINDERMELFHCLYEIQDEEFVKSATEYLKHMDVSLVSLRRAWTPMDFRVLGFCLKNSPGVERVNIRDIKMNPEDLGALTRGLTCTSLMMERCCVTASRCAELSSVLTTSSSLSELSLAGNKLMDSGVRELCKGLKNPGCKIQKLCLRRCSLTASCCADLSSVLINKPTLKVLDLSRNKLTDSGVRELSAGLKHQGCRIQKVLMINCSLTGSCCADLIFVFRTSSLTELDLSMNKLMDSGVRELCAGLKHPDCQIETLVMKICSLTAPCCTDLSSVLRTNSSLTELDLGDNELMDSGVRELCAGLKHPGCRIQKLCLRRCSLTASCCADLASVLKANSSLTELDLTGNRLMDSGVRELCAGLKHPDCKIQVLVLESCSLTASCCADLSSVLSTNSSPTELRLSRNKLMDSGVIELCAGLKHPDCRIQTLWLWDAGLTDGCTEALCSALHANQTLRRLQLSLNQFSARSEASFRELKESGRDLQLV